MSVSKVIALIFEKLLLSHKH